MSEEEVKELIGSYLDESLDALVAALLEDGTEKVLTYTNLVAVVASYVAEFVSESELNVTELTFQQWIENYHSDNIDWYNNVVGAYITNNFEHYSDDDINSMIDTRLSELGLI